MCRQVKQQCGDTGRVRIYHVATVKTAGEKKALLRLKLSRKLEICFLLAFKTANAQFPIDTYFSCKVSQCESYYTTLTCKLLYGTSSKNVNVKYKMLTQGVLGYTRIQSDHVSNQLQSCLS